MLSSCRVSTTRLHFFSHLLCLVSLSIRAKRCVPFLLSRRASGTAPALRLTAPPYRAAFRATSLWTARTSGTAPALQDRVRASVPRPPLRAPAPAWGLPHLQLGAGILSVSPIDVTNFLCFFIFTSHMRCLYYASCLDLGVVCSLSDRHSAAQTSCVLSHNCKHVAW